MTKEGLCVKGEQMGPFAAKEGWRWNHINQSEPVQIPEENAGKSVTWNMVTFFSLEL